jgi:signal peptidase
MAIDGPAIDRNGTIYIANLLEKGTIAKMEKGGEFKNWLSLPDHGLSSSIRFNSDNKMFVSDFKNHRIYRVDPNTAAIEKHYENPDLNQPNDMAIGADGSIYFSDPTWNRKKIGAIYRLNAKKELKKIVSGVNAGNGLDLSLDEKKLYFSESISGFLYQVDLTKIDDANYDPVSAALTMTKLMEFAPDTVDGVRTDTSGNIYVARITMQSVDQLAPNGTVLQSIPLLGKEPTNLTFGGNDGSSLIVTTRDENLVEVIRTKFTGREWSLLR